MRIIVIGGTGLAEQVASALHRAGDEVTVIDTEPGRESALAKAGLRAMYGDALVPSTLEAAGALKADVLVACTRSDEDNLVISLLAKKRFNVPRVIARVNDPANDELFDHSWGVDALVSPATSLVSRPTPRICDAVPQAQVTDARNCVFMGTSVVNGSGRAVVFATGLATEFGRIYRLTAEMPSEDSPLQREVTVMARRVAAVAIAAGLGLFAIRALASHDVVGSFVFALGVMVALVPEGLPATMSVSLAVAVRRMARRHAVIKRLTAVEALGSTTVICTDKTGTLTKAEMTVQAVWESGRDHGVTGVGYAPDGEVGEAACAGDVLRAGGLCCDARLLPPDPVRRRGWRVLGDTTEGPESRWPCRRRPAVPSPRPRSSPRRGRRPRWWRQRPPFLWPCRGRCRRCRR